LIAATFNEKALHKLKKRSCVAERQDFRIIAKCDERKPKNSRKQRGKYCIDKQSNRNVAKPKYYNGGEIELLQH
jgi:hypothetical protein